MKPNITSMHIAHGSVGLFALILITLAVIDISTGPSEKKFIVSEKATCVTEGDDTSLYACQFGSGLGSLTTVIDTWRYVTKSDKDNYEKASEGSPVLVKGYKVSDLAGIHYSQHAQPMTGAYVALSLGIVLFLSTVAFGSLGHTASGSAAKTKK